MGKQKYKEQLRDPRWQRVRLKVFERDNWQCQECGETTKTLTAHHTRYYKGYAPWDYSPGTIVTLCYDCHKERHPEKMNYAEWVKWIES